MTALARDALTALGDAYAREGSYAKVGRLLATAERPGGYSAGAVCQLLRGNYPAKSLAPIEATIRATLLNATVRCPALGEIARTACLEWRAKPFAATNPERVRMHRACRDGCPHSRLED